MSGSGVHRRRERARRRARGIDARDDPESATWAESCDVPCGKNASGYATAAPDRGVGDSLPKQSRARSHLQAQEHTSPGRKPDRSR